MKANDPQKKNEPVELTGKIVLKKFASGSKSEHEAVYLETQAGSYQLRRIGANPFLDPELKKLVGKEVKAVGLLKEPLFLASNISPA